MTNQSLDLSVIVAAYNESFVITKNVNLIIDELNKRPEINWELILVNDGSSDNTGELIEKIRENNSKVKVIQHRRNFGQGRALRSAFDICRGEIIITLDADLSYSTDYIFRMFDTLRVTKSDIVLASAYMKGGAAKNVPPHRLFLSRTSNRYLAKITGQHISTSTCVVRAYQREVIDSLILTSDGMDLQIEILAKASTMGFHICEIPALLEWSNEKAVGSNKTKKRTSKMNVMSTIYRYSLLGWLHRPASTFLVLSLLLILPGLYMAITILIVTVQMLSRNLVTLSLAFALQKTLRDLVTLHIQNIAFAGIFLGFGLLIFAFSLLFLQNKSYYDELARMIQKNKSVDK